MINPNEPVFLEIYRAEQRQKQELEEAKKARLYERNQEDMFIALKNALGELAAQQIRDEGYTVKVGSSYMWRFRRFGFKPYEYACQADREENKWFHVAIFEDDDPKNLKILQSPFAANEAKDIADKVDYLDAQHAKKAEKLHTPQEEETPASRFFRDVALRIRTNETLTYFEDMLIAQYHLWRDGSYYGQHDDDESEESTLYAATVDKRRDSMREHSFRLPSQSSRLECLAEMKALGMAWSE